MSRQINPELENLAEEIALAVATFDKNTEDGELAPDDWDRWFSVYDQDALLSYGFKYGFSNETMWGRDFLGNEYVVEFADDGGQGGACWYVIQDGIKQRLGPLRYSVVAGLFTSRKYVQIPRKLNIKQV